jgi:hypothetical protein
MDPLAKRVKMQRHIGVKKEQAYRPTVYCTPKPALCIFFFFFFLPMIFIYFLVMYYVIFTSNLKQP